jgi:hypothetical protein
MERMPILCFFPVVKFRAFRVLPVGVVFVAFHSLISDSYGFHLVLSLQWPVESLGECAVPYGYGLAFVSYSA